MRPKNTKYNLNKQVVLRNKAINKIKKKLLPNKKIIKIMLIGSSVKGTFGKYAPPGFRESLYSDFDFIVIVKNSYKIPSWLKKEPRGKPFPNSRLNLAYRNKKFIENKYDIEIFFIREKNFKNKIIQKLGEKAGIPMIKNSKHKNLIIYEPKIKAIIFDVDDTLIDFSKLATPVHIKVAKKLKIKIPNKTQLNRLYGKPWINIANKFWQKENHKKIKKEILKEYKKQNFKPIPGAIKVIKKLKDKYILGVVSSKSRAILKSQFKQTKIPYKNFKFMYADKDTKLNKPDPRVFSKAIKKLKLKRNEILYVGDSIYDCIATKKAKLKFVAVLTGHYSKKEFIKKGIKTKNILKSIKYLPKWLEND